AACRPSRSRRRPCQPRRSQLRRVETYAAASAPWPSPRQCSPRELSETSGDQVDEVPSGPRRDLPCISFRHSYGARTLVISLEAKVISVVAAEQRRIFLGLFRSDIAKWSRQSRRAPLLAVRGRSVALRTVGARALELQVILFLRGLFVFGTGQRGEERDQV